MKLSAATEMTCSSGTRGQYQPGRMRPDEPSPMPVEADLVASTCPTATVRAGVASWKREYDKAPSAGHDQATQPDPRAAVRREGLSGPENENEGPGDFNEASAIPASEHAQGLEASSSARLIVSMRPLADADAAIRLAPKYPDGYLLRSGVSNQRHEFDKAIADTSASAASKLDLATPTRSFCGGTRTIARMTWTRRSGTTPRRSGCAIGSEGARTLIRRQGEYLRVAATASTGQGDGRQRHSGAAIRGTPIVFAYQGAAYSPG